MTYYVVIFRYSEREVRLPFAITPGDFATACRLGRDLVAPIPGASYSHVEEVR